MSEELTTQVQEPNAPEAEEPQADERLDPRATIRDLLDRNHGPSEVDIERLKQQYGEVFVSAFSETEVYVWRPLMREEFRLLQAKLQDPQSDLDQLDYEEEVCKVCVLWPDMVTLTRSLEKKGGTASSLAEQIAQNSNFFNPQQAGLLVAKL